MQVVKPTTMTTSMLTSSTATEAYPVWNAGTAYSVGSRVVRLTNIYERLIAGTTATAPESDTVNWFVYSSSNKWSMFDTQVSSSTTATTSLTVVFSSGIIDTLAFINVNCTTITVTIRDGIGGSTVYTGSVGMQGDTPTDWYQYFFFDPLTQRTMGVFNNIPPYTSSSITVVFTGTGTISCGAVVFGRKSDIGLTQFGVQAGITDYSKKYTDVFGVTTFVKRDYSKKMSAQLMIDNLQLNRIQRTLYDLRATPCLWIGSDAPELEETTVVFGWYKDFSTTISYFSNSMCSLEIEGLV